MVSLLVCGSSQSPWPVITNDTFTAHNFHSRQVPMVGASVPQAPTCLYALEQIQFQIFMHKDRTTLK